MLEFNYDSNTLEKLCVKHGLKLLVLHGSYAKGQANDNSMICYHVAMAGRPLYERQKGDFPEFKLQSIARYMDTKKFRDLEKIYVKRAVGRA